MRSLTGRVLKRLAQMAAPGAGRCEACGALHGENRLCPECSRLLQPRTGGFCPRCGQTFGGNHDPVHLCAACRMEPPPWEALGFHAPYQDLLRELVLAFKFRQALHYGRLLRDMAVQAQSRMDGPLPQLVVPIPLHKKRLLRRGYNQSLELARPVARAIKVPLAFKALRRIRHTQPQTSLGPDLRRRNIRGAFAAEDSVRGKTVLLVDDVLTTGATMAECAATLRQAGAVRVDALVLGVAPAGSWQCRP